MTVAEPLSVVEAAVLQNFGLRDYNVMSRNSRSFDLAWHTALSLERQQHHVRVTNPPDYVLTNGQKG